MSQPPAYNRDADFTKNHGSIQNDTLLNSELDDVSTSINCIRDNLAMIQADDGGLKDGIVDKDAMADYVVEEIIAGVDRRAFIDKLGYVPADEEDFQNFINGGDSGKTVVKATNTTEYRTLSERFSDIVNVLDFGAVGDGVTDNVDAFNAARTEAVRRGTVAFIPPGNYYLSQQIYTYVNDENGVSRNRFVYFNDVKIDRNKCVPTKLITGCDLLNYYNTPFGTLMNFRWAFRFKDATKKAAFIAKALELRAEVAEAAENDGLVYGNWNPCPPDLTDKIDCSTFIDWCLLEIGYENFRQSDGRKQVLGTELSEWMRANTTDFLEIRNPRNLQRGDIVFTGASVTLSAVSHVYMFWSYNLGVGVGSDATLTDTTTTPHCITTYTPDGAFIAGNLTRYVPNEVSALNIALDDAVSEGNIGQYVTFFDEQDNVIGQLQRVRLILEDDVISQATRLTVRDTENNKIGLIGVEYRSDKTYPILSLAQGLTRLFEVDPSSGVTLNGKSGVFIEESGEGYIRYTDGTQICYGKKTNVKTSNPDTLTFAKQFVDTNYAFNATPELSGSYEGFAFCCTYSNPQKGSISVGVRKGDGTFYSSGSSNFRYTAIGKWK